MCTDVWCYGGAPPRFDNSFRFHQMVEERKDVPMPQLLPVVRLATPVNAVDLKDMIGDIQADRENLSRGRAPCA